jgi:hypothetical protein
MRNFLSLSVFRNQAISTYTAVVHNLNDGGKLALVRTVADQHKAANLNQLPGSDLDIDIGHVEILDEKFSAGLLVVESNCILTVGGYVYGLSKEFNCPEVGSKFRDVPTTRNSRLIGHSQQ